MGSGLEEDRERNVGARRKDFQKRGGVKPLNPVEPDGEPDTILDGESRNNCRSSPALRPFVTSTWSKPSFLIYLP